MSEQLHQNPEHEPPIELTNEVRMAMLLGEIQEGARILAKTDFKSEEDVVTAQAIYLKNYYEKLQSLESPFLVDIIMSGEGVMVPQATIKRLDHDEHGSGLFVSMGDRTMRSLLPGEEMTGRILGIFGDVNESERPGCYNGSLFFDMLLQGVQKRGIPIAGTELNVVDITVGQHAIVDTARSSFDIVKLREESKKEALQMDMERIGLTEGQFSEQLQRLNQELSREVPNQYIPLDLELIKSLGDLSSVEAQKGEDHAYIVSRVVLESLKLYRPVEVVFNEQISELAMQERKVKGNIVDVFMVDQDEDVPELAIAIQEYDPSIEQPPIHLVKFNQISVFGF